MEKQKYLYKNPKCVGGTSSTISLINAWISITGQRNIQKYRSIAYLGGFTIVALATIWFLSQSPTYTIEYNKSKDKSEKSNKSDKSNKLNNKKDDDMGKSDKRSNNTNKSSVSWLSSIREKIINKLGFGKKSKSKNIKIGKSPSSRNNSTKNVKSNAKKRIPKDNGACSSTSSSKTSDAKPTGSICSSNIKNNIHEGKSTNIVKKIQGPRCGNSSNDSLQQKDSENLISSYGDSSSSIHNNCRQKDQITQKIRVGSCGDSSSSVSDNLRQKDKITQEIRVKSHGDSSSSISNNLCKKDQITQESCCCSSSSSHNNCRQKDQTTQEIRAESCGDSSSSINNLHQKNKITQEIRAESCGSSFTSNEVKQQQLRKLRLKTQETRSSSWTNRENKYRLKDYSIPKRPEKDNLTSPIRNVKCFTKSLCQDIDNKESLTDLEEKIAMTIKKINLIDLQVRENYREFYIPYTPLTLHETFDKIEQERVERYKKLLVKLGRQKQEDSNLESILRMVQEFFHEKRYYDTSDDEDENCHEKRDDHSDEFVDFLNYIQNATRTKVTSNDNFDCNKCPKFSDILAYDEQASRKRIERNFEILKMIDSYEQQGKETEASIKKSIEMFNEQRAKYKGATRHLKRPLRFYDELNRFEDRLMDLKQQADNLAEGLDDMEACFTETLELFNDDGKMDNAVAKYGPILIDDD
ncbi:hypothetical protein C1645_745525 [Glomus cerebriforme]|uniref:Uncharacterized protein n=1 Tax=Glomus cerebriforme TaxID=658196 RepID=A0A397S6R9_9GLOM|nr:hypothetical protein C1645_745525 [Glomus cerebriforme]